MILFDITPAKLVPTGGEQNSIISVNHQRSRLPRVQER